MASLETSKDLVIVSDPEIIGDQLRAIDFAQQAADSKGWKPIHIEGRPRLVYEDMVNKIGALLVIPNASKPERTHRGCLFRRRISEFSLMDLITMTADKTKTSVAVIADARNPVQIPKSGNHVKVIACSLWRSDAFLGVGDWLDDVASSQAATQLFNLADVRKSKAKAS